MKHFSRLSKTLMLKSINIIEVQMRRMKRKIMTLYLLNWVEDKKEIIAISRTIKKIFIISQLFVLGRDHIINDYL